MMNAFSSLNMTNNKDKHDAFNTLQSFNMTNNNNTNTIGSGFDNAYKQTFPLSPR
jgi:hypothetical protein